MRRFLNRRTFLIAAVIVVLAAVSGLLALAVFVNSPAFNERIHGFIVREIETRTGGEASLGNVRWSLREQRLVLEDLTLRGTEPDSEPPLARVESISAGFNLRTLLQRRLDLFELRVRNPQFRILVDSEGRTNLPAPPPRVDSNQTQFAVAIEDFEISGGTALVNDKRHNFDLTLANLVSDLRYTSTTGVLSAGLGYTGTFSREGQSPIRYELTSDLDFTRGAVVAQRVDVRSGESALTLQGRIDKFLTRDITGRLDYGGTWQVDFLNHFFPRDRFDGLAKTSGSLEFSASHFSADGNVESDRVEFNEWRTQALRAGYTYRFPERQLAVGSFTAGALDGAASGTLGVENIPGAPRVRMDIRYEDIDATLLSRVYPWDPRYRIYSRADGRLQGWFEGRIDRFEFEGESNLRSYSPQPETGVVAFPIDGSLAYSARPGSVDLKSSDVRFFSTSIAASGLVNEASSLLTVNLTSSNLANLYFLYKDANGAGSFQGTLSGPLRTPLLEGNVTLDEHKHGVWTFRHAAGRVRLDTLTEVADLSGVALSIGQSRATIDGTANLDGSKVDLRIQSDDIKAEDFASLVNEKVSGDLSGDVRVTSVAPLQVRGHVRGSGLTVRGHDLETVEGDLTYSDPAVEVRNLTASGRGATLRSGILDFDWKTEAIRFEADLGSLNADLLREAGVPDTVGGFVEQVHLEIEGTRSRPEIQGNATIRDLSFHEEVFPRARATFSTEWPHMSVKLAEMQNVDVSARIDLSADSYPVEATIQFRNYAVERLARFSQGTINASGEANLKGLLARKEGFEGNGAIRAIRAQIRDYEFSAAKPFTFKFDSSRLTLSEMLLDGELGTQVRLQGSVGLMEPPTLDLNASGSLDLGVIAAANTSWSITGKVDFDGRISGTTRTPSLFGRAHFSNTSLGREGIYTTLSMLNGDIRFNDNLVTFDDLQGRVGGGAVRVRGTGLLEEGRMEALNVRLEADQVRVRYPAGLRSLVDGTLVLRGSSMEPLLEGNLTIDSLSYRNDFEPFLAFFRPGGLDSAGTSLDNLRLSVHLSGNRNIAIQNELADVTEARVDLDIKGTVGSPSLTGHVEATGGTLFFHGKRYDITRGNIDFVDPLRIDPVVDIQAETDLRDYRVILNIVGRSDRVRVDLRSDPPLPQLELVSLIAGGQTRDELATQAGTASLPTSEQLFQGGAASILVDLLRSRVGSRFGLLGLDRVQIDPSFGTGSNPSARITLSEQVTKDLSVTYSQDLASSQQRVILIEYFLSKDLSIVASREETNDTTALGLDVRLRRRF